jgi:hypothetical protein
MTNIWNLIFGCIHVIKLKKLQKDKILIKSELISQVDIT